MVVLNTQNIAVASIHQQMKYPNGGTSPSGNLQSDWELEFGMLKISFRLADILYVHRWKW